MFTGSIVPILNKMLKAGNIPTTSKWQSKPYRVVRVDTSNAALDLDEKEKTPQQQGQEELSDTEDDQDREAVQAKPLIGGEDDHGLGVARPFAKTSIFRGIITKYKDDDENEHTDPSGSFMAKFTDGSKFKMDADKANAARRLFEKQANLLVKNGMSREDVCNCLDEHTVASLNVKTKARSPVLSDGEDQDPENHEKIFEEKFNGKVPDAVVGLMFDNKIVRATDAMNNAVDVHLWHKVLM